jgi:hypothetical protein
MQEPEGAMRSWMTASAIRAATLALAVFAGACASSTEVPFSADEVDLTDDGGDEAAGGDDATGADAEADGDDDGDGDTIDDSVDNCPRVANFEQIDGDGDAIGDDCDCAPSDGGVAAYLVAGEDLASDHGAFAPAAGFDHANWGYEGGAYRQTSLRDDGSDASFFAEDFQAPRVVVEVRVASTDIASFGSNDLRQLFVTMNSTSDGSTYAASACGIEVVEGQSHTQKTSIVNLGGGPESVETEAAERIDRPAVQEDEEVAIRFEVYGESRTCTVELADGSVTTATAAGAVAGQTVGTIGLYTRETKAAFKALRVCAYPE